MPAALVQVALLSAHVSTLGHFSDIKNITLLFCVISLSTFALIDDCVIVMLDPVRFAGEFDNVDTVGESHIVRSGKEFVSEHLDSLFKKACNIG